MIVREHYIRQVRPFYDSDLIKILTGIRRCGKSVIKDQIEQELRDQGYPTISLNFEDRSVSSMIPTGDELIRYVNEHLQQEKTYVFLDEVQTIKDWNTACRSLRLKNLSLFITGSNSKLLSGEFTKELSGRYVAFSVRPFVYRELCEYAKELNKTYSVQEYLIYGGFPQTLEFDTKEAVLRYLNNLDETIVMNHIMNRYRIRKEELFKRFVNYVLMSNGRIFSASSIQKYLRGEQISCSLNTIMNYLSHLEEAYVIRRIPQFSTKVRRQLRFYEKLYDEDVAFNSIRQRGGRFDLSHNMENIVYNELIYRNYELYVFNKGGKEINFLAEKDGKQYLVQVAYSIVEEHAYQREFRLFDQMDQSRRKIIITNDELDYSTSTVTHIPFSRFLMSGDDAF